MKIVLTLILVIHGFIHIIGFIKAFRLAEVKDLKSQISKPFGLVWLMTSLILICTAGLYLIGHELWWVLGLCGIFTSQVVIFKTWSEAKYGSLVNLLLILIIIFEFGYWSFQNQFKADVKLVVKETFTEESIIKEEDLNNLPNVVRDYLKYVGVVGKPHIHNVKVSLEGQMRNKGEPWFDFTSLQYNALRGDYARLFFMDADINHIPAVGYHYYKSDSASMLVKAISFIPVITMGGSDFYKAETVTLFNDMCLIAPASLINNDNVRWEVIDHNSVKAFFKNQGVEISAILHFDEQNRLINFISEDRLARNPNGELERLTFSTPVEEYRETNGYMLPYYAYGVWTYPDGDFTYTKIFVTGVEYNVSPISL